MRRSNPLPTVKLPARTREQTVAYLAEVDGLRPQDIAAAKAMQEAAEEYGVKLWSVMVRIPDVHVEGGWRYVYVPVEVANSPAYFRI